MAPGQMDFGLGIHGEPGITSDAWMPALALAAEQAELRRIDGDAGDGHHGIGMSWGAQAATEAASNVDENVDFEDTVTGQRCGPSAGSA